jgi:O-methyltransferase
MRGITKAYQKLGEFLKIEPPKATYLHADFSPQENKIWQLVQPFTMTSPERLVAFTRAIDYVIKNNIAGDVVECGVWKGGSIMAALQTLVYQQITNKNIYLYDTFEGMSEPTNEDKSFDGRAAQMQLNEADKLKSIVWCYSTLDEVQANIAKIDYPLANIHFVQGKVEDTIPATMPEKIAILRLDTDWYASTKHELVHLFPRLVRGGILIIDDYGHWEGCRKAVDEYFEAQNISIFLSRIDYTGRIGVKL